MPAVVNMSRAQPACADPARYYRRLGEPQGHAESKPKTVRAPHQLDRPNYFDSLDSKGAYVSSSPLPNLDRGKKSSRGESKISAIKIGARGKNLLYIMYIINKQNESLLAPGLLPRGLNPIKKNIARGVIDI